MPTEVTEPLIVAPGSGKSFWVVTDFITIKTTGEETGGRFAVIETLIVPQAGPPPHIHHHETETFYVLEGELTFFFGDRTVIAGPGTFLHAPKDKLHTFKNQTDKPVRILVWICPAGLEKMFPEIGHPATDSETPVPVTPEDILRLIEVAPKYGLEIPPPPHS